MRGMSSEPTECTGEVEAVEEADDYASELHLAVKENDVPAIRKLLERGAKVNACDKFGRTPLHWALVYGHQEAAMALILNTAKRALDSRDSCGCTALHYAALGGRTEVGRILIERGGQVNSVDSRQRTPLHLAAQHPKPAMVEMLISRGADKSCRDFREYLPWDVALEWASFSSLACLRPDSQKKDPNLMKVHPVEMVDDEQDGGAAVAAVDVAVRHGPSLDKLMESWKNAENEVRRKKEAESEVAARAFAEVQKRLQEWKAAEKDARLRQRGGGSRLIFGPISVDGSGINDAHSQVQDHFSEAVLSPRVEPSTAGPGAFSSIPSCSQPESSLRASAVECSDDEPYSSLSSSLFPSASSSCQGDPGSPPNLLDWLDSSEQYSKTKACPKEALLWCTEWEVELPRRRSARSEHMGQEDVLNTPPTSPRERKGKAKAVPEEELLWVQVWPKPSPFPPTSLPSRSQTVTAI